MHIHICDAREGASLGKPAQEEAAPAERDSAEPTWGVGTVELPTNIIPTNILDSNFPGNPLWAWEFHPLELILCSSQTL